MGENTLELDAHGPKGFRDLTLVGAGATSRVYRATEDRAGRVVALKRLHRQLVRDNKALARMRRELEALKKLRHPGIVSVHDVVEWEGDPTIVMDFIPGEDLKERLVREGVLPAAEVERIGRALLDILAITHGSGIVHRDLKPQNVRMGPDGHVYLLDFGSARLDAESQLTTTGATVGTPEYMAPELFVGSVYDPRVDIFGVGAVLYECLTARPPQSADSLAALSFLRTTVDIEPVAVATPGVPETLAQVIDRCLARQPEDRYVSASLAIWALDNPRAERAFSARRSAHPLCLHCSTPIPPESAVCGGCQSDRPFAYAPGPCTVLVLTVADPSDLLGYTAERFPERARPDHLAALADRCAALSFGPQPFVSFISRSDASHVVEELHRRGVRAEVKVEPRLGGLYLTLACLVALAGALKGEALVGLGAVLGVLTIGRLSAFAQARGSLLSTARWPRPLAPDVFAALIGASALWLSAHALVWIAAQPWDVPSPAARWWLSWAGWAWMGAAVVTFAASFHHPRMRRMQAAQPSLLAQLSATFSDRAADAESARTRQSRLGAGILIVLAAFMVEVVLLQAIVRWEPGSQSLLERPKTAAKRAAPNPLAMLTPGEAGISGSFSSRRRLPVEPVAGCLTLTALLAAFHLRRRQRIRREGASIVAGLDLEMFRRLATRSDPSRQPRRQTAADRIARLTSVDPFVAEAVKRAAVLAHCLPGDAIAQLSDSLVALEKRRPGAPEARRSLLTRCIAESDPEQKARLAFLALEGQLEATAAAAWAKRAIRRARS